MIYLLEDDDNIRNFVVYALCQTEMKAKGFETSETFWRAMETEIPELVLLDIMLPKEDGLSVLRRLRADPRFASLPVIMLTAKATEYDKVLGLDSGADDYLAKPYDLEVLVARVEARLRQESAKNRYISYGSLRLDTFSGCGYIGGRDLQLTQKEFAMLLLLVRNAEKTVSKQQVAARGVEHRLGGRQPRPLDADLPAAAQAQQPGVAHRDFLQARGWLHA